MSSDPVSASDELARTEIGKFLLADADEIALARRKAIEAHHTDDIRAAGNEVENAVRSRLQARLPGALRVAQGHIVDSELHTSPQLDVIVSDASDTIVLAAMADGTEYLPYESVYAVGEVKSTYYSSKKPIESFSNTLEKIRSGLTRARTDANFLGRGVAVGPGLKLDDSRPNRSPLFSFMFFVDSGDFKVESVAELYRERPRTFLPTVVCLLDKGVLAAARIRGSPSGQATLGPISVAPENETDVADEPLNWTFLPLGEPQLRPAANFGLLYFLLVSHCNSCRLVGPDLLKYLGGVFKFEAGSVLGKVR